MHKSFQVKEMFDQQRPQLRSLHSTWKFLGSSPGPAPYLCRSWEAPVMDQILGLLLLSWETWIKLLDLGSRLFRLAFGKWAIRHNTLTHSLTLCFSNKNTYKSTCNFSLSHQHKISLRRNFAISSIFKICHYFSFYIQVWVFSFLLIMPEMIMLDALSADMNYLASSEDF